MIKILDYNDNLDRIFKRKSVDLYSVMPTVMQIVSDVREHGDAALNTYREKFDNLTCSLKVSDAELAAAYNNVTKAQLSAIRHARDNVLDFHIKQLQKERAFEYNGKTLGWVYRPVGCAGIYVPGGKAEYPSTVVMCACAARAAGVKKIVMATPGASPLTLVAAKECGVDTVYRMGGAQAIAAMAFGTESVVKADVISGPGNIYVAAAKKAVYGDVNIDMIAGPSEIVVIADKSAKPEWVIADLLSQAEHDELAMSVLITDSAELAQAVANGLPQAIENQPRKAIIKKSIDDFGTIVVTNSIKQAVTLSNKIAPEHLELYIENPEKCLDDIQNAGCVFMGKFTSEPVGDYYCGTNHVLPTGGTARAFSGLGVSNFIKRVNYVMYDETALNDDAEHIEELAKAESLYAHAAAVSIRKTDLK